MHQDHSASGRAPGALHVEAALVMRPAADAARFSLRIDPKHLDAASTAFGLRFPETIGHMVQGGGRTAVALGPDEWYLMAPLPEGEPIERSFAALYASVIHSLVDISDREVGIELEGARAALALQSAIAFDVEAMPVGSGCRTVFDRVQIILLRETEHRFRIEVWRSFADHVGQLIEAVAREVELDV
jgi:sarcosine oxidase, subunit gamma